MAGANLLAGARHPLLVLPVLMLSRLVVRGRPQVFCSVRSLDPLKVSIGYFSASVVSVALVCPLKSGAPASSGAHHLRLSCHHLQDLCYDLRREEGRRSQPHSGLAMENAEAGLLCEGGYGCCPSVVLRATVEPTLGRREGIDGRIPMRSWFNAWRPI